MGRFLIWLSGANREVLAKTPGESGKYEGLGGVVLTTAVMAALSAGLALHLALQAPIVVCVAIGLFWGLAIANLDRWLVGAFPRRDTVGKNFLQALPRLLMALLIGVVVSTPLVLRVFNNEIEKEIAAQHDVTRDQERRAIFARYQVGVWEKKVATDEAYLAAKDGNDQVVKDQPNVKAAARAAYQADQAYKRALDSGVRVEAASNERDARRRQYSAAVASAVTHLHTVGNQNIGADRQELERRRDGQAAALQESADTISRNKGLLMRVEALSSLRSKDSGVQATYLVLWAFITLVEVLPVLLKFLMTLGAPGPYEVALASYNQDQIKSAEQHIEHASKAREEELAARARLRTKQTELSAELGEQEMRRRLDRASQRTSGSTLFGP
ncbi:DUF4407 domain-containing protein [Cryptosporangium minutisporangium]|uniref:DUF4407 domain-containing protein n=1 Tax=Cryptosporangium minutisporangium TaxID=113569 RepID=A0ABP6TCM0_9ACTN